MADGVPPRDPEMAAPPAPQPQPEPPPLDSIRVRGQAARGLNKPAILVAAGGGVAIVLLLASGAFSNGPERRPSETKPLMSDPARPEMAKGAIRSLPTDYTQVAPPQPAASVATSPQPGPPQPGPSEFGPPEPGPPSLGPPLPGDVAAFGQSAPALRSYAQADDDGWNEPPGHAPASPADPREVEGEEAMRAGLFFALRDQTAPGAAQPTPGFTPQKSSSTLTAFAPTAQDEPRTDGATDRVLFPGAVIPASLVTEVNSDAPGPVIAQVTQATYDSATGRTLLIPQGARLIGDYRSSARYGQSRVAIVWSRLIMPDGREVALEEAALDPAGAAGVSGNVDNHLADVFGAAALGTLISIGVATTEEPVAYGGSGLFLRDPVDDAIKDGVQRAASSVSSRVVDRGLAIPPTIRVSAGAKLTVIVTRRTRL